MRKLFALALALTLSFTIVSCSNSDDEVIRIPPTVDLIPGQWVTDKLQYSMGPGMDMSHDYSEMVGHFGDEFFEKEIITVVSEDEVYLKQYQGNGNVLGPFKARVEADEIVFENKDINPRKIVKSVSYELTLDYPIYMAKYNQTLVVRVTHNPIIED